MWASIRGSKRSIGMLRFEVVTVQGLGSGAVGLGLLKSQGCEFSVKT